MQAEYMEDTCQAYFDELLAVIENEYAKFHHVIISELNDLSIKLVFDRSKVNSSLFTNDDFVIPASASYDDIAASGTTAATYGNIENTEYSYCKPD